MRLKPMFSSTLYLYLCLLVAGPAPAQEFSSLEERMSHSEFTAAGLDKLSPEELAALNDWLRGSMRSASQAALASTAPIRPEDRVGFERSGVFDWPDSRTVESRIKGRFTGWDRKGQRFELENGQIWEVVESDSILRGVRAENPVASIQSGMLGVWYLRVEGHNARVKVKRVK